MLEPVDPMDGAEALGRADRKAYSLKKAKVAVARKLAVDHAPDVARRLELPVDSKERASMI